ncbi:MAG: hypothetical protein EP326_14125 [Deltaproteobacteria bacterium]|nr:MAG: hypothetical protein EP326_14125 [Deltaproteobacteria bacterium]TNF24752.1 MAG: hypothetical protein EP319_17705 [Deltaproteobacteria bacterium]
MKTSPIAKVIIFIFSILGVTVQADLPKWSYDAGPSTETEMGRELIDLTADIPNMPEISYKLTKSQKFRPAFGPIPWRMRLEPNSVKMLFIGQDGTHIAEAAGRPATAGFGGRAQDLAKYFGVNESAAFINTYAFTIKGQYGSYQTPYIYEKNGERSVRFSNLVDNQLWLMTQDNGSPIAKWRNNLIDWIVKNNRDSMRLIVTFGGAARDAVASYIESKGGKVGSRSENSMENIQVPEIKLQYAGGNNQFPTPINEKGYDLYSDMLGRKVDYKDVSEQSAVVEDLQANLEAYIEKMVFSKGGPYNNGLLHPAQLGGYDLARAVIKGTRTRSLKGLKLNDGTVIENDILFVELPHPSFLSRLSKTEASEAVGSKVEDLKKYVAEGWTIEADPGQENQFVAGKPYKYSRADIGPEFYDFGTPGSRMVSVSTASRMSGKAHVIVFGTRDRVKFNMSKIDEMTDALPGDEFSEEELFIARPRSFDLRYVFDAGPGEKYAKIMKENLNLKEIFKSKPGMSFRNDGIAALNVKNNDEVADFGHYRGTFVNPKVVVLADPHGWDDLITSRALTGTRGQYLHGLMRDLGVEDQYLVIKTVPFGMEGATDEEWSVVLEQTAQYRQKLFAQIMKDSKPDFIITDGDYAKEEIKNLVASGVKVINLSRRDSSMTYGFEAAAKKISKFIGYKGVEASGQMANIPRSHLSFYARTWEGTSGDRVINGQGKHAGMAFAEVAPAWAFEQKTEIKDETEMEIDLLINKLIEGGFPLPGEKIQNFIERREIQPGLSFIEKFVAELVRVA